MLNQFCATRPLPPLEDRGPLKVMFVNTSLPVGGAEVLLADLVRGFDRERFLPELCCLKELGPVGRELSRDVPAFANLLSHKADVRVFFRLRRLFTDRRIDVVITVGAGDKMFWGRLAAAAAGVPVVLAALHSTGYPDSIQRPNRWLNRITDAFIAVAPTHGRYLEQTEQLPPPKIRVIPNGIDIARFRPDMECGSQRDELHLPPDCPVVGIIAALRPEKDHVLFLSAATKVRELVPNARFLVVGDGPLRSELESNAKSLDLNDSVHFLGNRTDIPQLLCMMDVFILTSKMEASPVSILEAMGCAKPVVAPAVGSIPDSLLDGTTGFLYPAGDRRRLVQRLVELLRDRQLAARMGAAGRDRVQSHGSVERMVTAYQDLIWRIYRSKCAPRQSHDAAATRAGGPTAADESRSPSRTEP